MHTSDADILRNALAPSGESPEHSLYDRIRARFEPLGGVELELPNREPVGEPPRFA